MATSHEHSPPALSALVDALKAVYLAGCWLRGEDGWDWWKISKLVDRTRLNYPENRAMLTELRSGSGVQRPLKDQRQPRVSDSSSQSRPSLLDVAMASR
jgi:hypothetical protein